ncbi:MAG: RHS repeat-associated core domain-containing protein [Rubrivivax sp.]
MRKLDLKHVGQALRALLTVALMAVAVPAVAFHFPWDQGHDTTTSNDPPPPGPCEGPTCDDDCGSNASRSPVYAALGHALWRNTDVVLRGRPYLGIYRVYNSNDPVVGLFGNGWSVCFDVALYPANNSGVPQRIYKAANGKRFVYVKQPDGSFRAPDARFDTIVESANTVTMTALDGRRMVFAPDGRLLERSDVNDNRVTFDYDSATRPVRMADTSGRSLQFAYNGASLVASVTDHTGRVWRYGYDTAANLTSVTDPLGGVMRYTWQPYRPSGDANTYYQLLSVTDAANVVQISFTYSGNQVASYTEGANRYTYTRPTTNTTLAGTVTRRDSLNVATSFTYGALGLVTQDVDGIGGRTSYTYDSNGRVTATVDALNRSWSSSYDALGRMTASSNPLGQSGSVQYSGNDPRPVRMTSPSGRVVALSYDSRGNLLSTVDPVGATTVMTYSARGDVTGIRNALTQQTAIVYTASGLPTQVTDPLSRTSTMSYDALGRVTTATNAAGETTRYGYDVLDRASTVTDPLGQITSFSYDTAGRLLSVTDAKASVTQYQYDSNGRRSAEVAPDGRRTSYTYRTDNLLSQITWPDNTTIVYTYDNNKRVTRETAGTEVINYSYNAVNQLTSSTGPGGTVAYTYDNASRVVTETSGGKTNTITRNAEGERTRLDYLGQTQTYTRDNRGLVTRIAAPAGNFDFGFDALGRRTQLSYPNGSSASYAFDAAGQLTNLTHAGVFNAPYAHSFDAAGRITKVTGDGGDWNYSYDALGRLTQATQDASRAQSKQAKQAQAAASTTTYTLDAVGNILDGGRTYDVNHRLTADAAKTYSYDLRGNLTLERERTTGARTVYTWNVKNQLKQVHFFANATAGSLSRTLTYTYDPLGRRASKVDNATTQKFVYDGDDLVGTLDAGNATTVATVFSGAVDEPLSTTTAGSPKTLYANHLGSVKAVADGATLTHAYGYSPYGETQPGSSPDSTPFRYTGREKDTDSLYYYRARYYSTAQQRFVSQDPLGVQGGINTYGYVSNDPISENDPTGKCPWCIGAAIGFGFDLVSQLVENGGNWHCISLGRLAASTALGAVGGGLGGRGLTGLMRGLSNGTKGQIGETLSIVNNRLGGSRLLSTQTRSIPGQRTIVDSTWRSLTGSTYYVESKFGTSGLTAAQRAARGAVGEAYHVERWGYPFFERVGAYGGGAAAGAGASTAAGGDCGCN